MVGTAVIVGFFLLSGVNVIISLFSLFATRRETEALKAELAAVKVDGSAAVQSLEAKTRQTTTALFEKLGHLEHGLRGEFRDDLESLRALIVEASKSMAGLSSTCEMLNQSLTVAHARLDRLNERLNQREDK